jgi:ABC-type transport system involved in multi-copper enzyme maturation permease subunit
MSRAFRSEWFKIRRPAVLLGGLGSMIAVALLAVILTIVRADNGRGAVTVAHLSQADGFSQMMSRASDLLGIFALGIVAVAMAQEYSNGTLRALLMREPRRLRLLGGKLLANLVYLAGSVLVAMLLALLVAVIAAPSKGISTSAWFGAGLGTTMSVFGNMVIAAVGFGVFGALLALLTRAPAPAVIAGVAWILPVENLLANAWPNVGHWLPGQQLTAIIAGGNTISGYTWALALGLSMAAVAVAASATLFWRRDVAV